MRTPLDKARSDPSSAKAAILRAARKIFARHGYHGATTRGIAEEVGIDVSTLYYHWGSKGDLFEGVLQDIQQQFEELIRVWVHRAKDAPFEEGFDLAIELLGPFLNDRDAVRVLMFSFFDDEFEGGDWAVRSQRRLVGTVRKFIERRVGADTLPPHFDALIVGSIASILALIGGRAHHARVLGMDPESDEYRVMVIQLARGSLAVFRNNLINIRG